MLFNSFNFLFIFLPASLVTYFYLAKINSGFARALLSLWSLIFYAYWDFHFLPLLIGSIAVNYAIGLKILENSGKSKAKYILILGLAFNLGLLSYFKYAVLAFHTVDYFSAEHHNWPTIILPIGISFFTFTQIAFLVDAFKFGIKDYKFFDYMLFVSYFPHQIAGPILHHKEMMGQFLSKSKVEIDYKLLAVGISLFSLGLVKKVVFADTLADFANPVFNNAEAGVSPKFFESWGAALAYTFQLYFDFSAYSDMAVGISLMFGIRLPANFYSPYKSTNIIEFWRRWHMTLSRFLKDYLYIPLGGNQGGPGSKYINIFVTMALGGLWHGASWTFLLWGCLHGTFLIINHGWRATSLAKNLVHNNIFRNLSWVMTFFAVVIAWVVFRSESFSGSYLMVKSMLSFESISIPPQMGSVMSNFFIADPEWSGALGGIRAIVIILACFPVVLFFPNLQQIFAEYKPTIDALPRDQNKSTLKWRPTFIWAIIIACALGLSATRFGVDSNFLYFNF